MGRTMGRTMGRIYIYIYTCITGIYHILNIMKNVLTYKRYTKYTLFKFVLLLHFPYCTEFSL